MSKIPSIELAQEGYKAGKVYSILPTNGHGDLTFTRTSIANRKNGQGVIEEMGVNVPRLDYSDGGCPVLLLEPTSTNLVDYSSDFTQWTTQRLNLSPNVITSPKGDLTGSLIVPTAVNGSHQLERGMTSSPSGTYSIYIKADGYSAIRINSGSSSNGFAEFDTVTESVINSSGTFFEKAKITKEVNGWYRCELTLGSGLSGNGLFVYVLNELNQQSYTADGTSGIYVWHGQVEEQLYATSPIETNGTIETRTEDQASKSGLVNYINSKKGVLYLDAQCFDDDTTNNFYGVKSSTQNSHIYIYGGAGISKKWQCNVRVKGVNYYFSAGNIITVEKNIKAKIAVVWEEKEFTFYINGFKGSTEIVANAFDVGELDNFGLSLSSKFYGKVKGARVYDNVMTEQELIDLTSIFYSSFNQMANKLNYNII